MTKYRVPLIVFSSNEIVNKDTKTTHGLKVGQIAFDYVNKEFYQLIARNPHVWRQIRNPDTVKEGKCEFVGTTLKGEGVMSDISSLGATFSGNAIDGTGTAQSSSTGTASIRNAGFGIIPPIASDAQGLCRTNHLPYYFIKFVIPGRSSGDERLYNGWIKNSIGPAVSDNPIPNTEGGIVVGFNSTDANFNIWNSNGDGVTAVSKTEMDLIPAPTGFIHYKIEMIFTSTTVVVVNVYNSTFTLLQSKTINSNLLASGKSMNWVAAIQNPLQTNKTLTGYAVKMKFFS